MTGGAIGAAVGALAVAAATLVFPGLGLVLGGGLLTTVVGGAALGAAGGSLLGTFVALEMSEADAAYYARAVQEEGRTVVLVQTPRTARRRARGAILAAERGGSGHAGPAAINGAQASRLHHLSG